MSEEQLLKERIISFAFDRFRTEGFAKVSVDDIAASLVISKKTFYKVFKSKEDLVVQIMNRHLGEVSTTVERIVSGNQSFVAKLGALLSYLGTIPGRVGIALLQDVQRHMPYLWKRIEQFRSERVTSLFGHLIDQGMAEGYIRHDLNKRIFLLSYMAAIQQIVQPSVLANESFSAQEAISSILELFFKGALTDLGRKEFSSAQHHQPAHTS